MYFEQRLPFTPNCQEKQVLTRKDSLTKAIQYITTAQKIKFSIKDFFSKCDQIRRKLRIWSHLLEKSLMENFIFCAVYIQYIFFAK